MTHDAGTENFAGSRPQVLVFGGTSEGRQLVEWLAARGTCDIVACSATDYGGSLLPELPSVTALVDRLDEPAMRALMESRPFACAVDATHPYAVEVSANIASAAQAAGLPFMRVVRADDDAGDWTQVPDVAAAARHVAQRPGNVLLTTGSKDLAAFVQAIPDFEERLFVRILPVQASLEHALDLGIAVDHIVAMQGPFSAELNAALVHDLGIALMVTKASGTRGGFPQKVQAARACGIELVVIDRPSDEQGLSLDDARRALAERFGV